MQYNIKKTILRFTLKIWITLNIIDSVFMFLCFFNFLSFCYFFTDSTDDFVEDETGMVLLTHKASFRAIKEAWICFKHNSSLHTTTFGITGDIRFVV